MHRFRFSKSEKIKSKKIFDRTLLFGKKIVSSNNKLKCSFIIEDIDSESQENLLIKVAFTVSKKSGKAHWRNRFKRILREIYRLNKYLLIDPLKSNSKRICLIISSYKLNEKTNSKLKYQDIEKDALELFEMIKKEIEKE